MTINTTYECDRCHVISPKRDDVRGIAIIVSNSSYQTTAHAKVFDKHWCLSCLKRFDLVPQPAVDKPSPPPTLEDIILEMVSDAVADAMDN